MTIEADLLGGNAALVDAVGSALQRGGNAVGSVPDLLKQVLTEESWRELLTLSDIRVGDLASSVRDLSPLIVAMAGRNLQRQHKNVACAATLGDDFGRDQLVTDHDSQAFRPNNTVTVHGTNSGNIASGNRDVTQLASTQSNMATADIAEIMRAVIEVAGSLNMADRDREELVRAAEFAQYEIEGPNPDEGEIKSLGSRVIRFLGRTGGSVVPVVLTKYLELKLGLGSAA